MSKMIYVHIDTTSNAVLSQGIAARDFNQSIIHQPKNLLLLDPASEFGEFETHTGLKVIRGSEAVNHYFSQLNRGRVTEEIKWIDFTELNLIKELSPLEISELLYFGHMKLQLHSPFFYKLQNNFVYFGLEEQRARIYYRYLDEFYRVLADKLTHITLENVNDKLSFFKKATPVDKPELNLLKSLRGLMQEGIVFCFEQEQLLNKVYTIPIYLIDDSPIKAAKLSLKSNNQVATLTYHTNKRNWELAIEDEDLGFLTSMKIN